MYGAFVRDRAGDAIGGGGAGQTTGNVQLRRIEAPLNFDAASKDRHDRGKKGGGGSGGGGSGGTDAKHAQDANWNGKRKTTWLVLERNIVA